MSATNMQDFFRTYGKLAHPINGTTQTGAQIQCTLESDDQRDWSEPSGSAFHDKLTTAAPIHESPTPICTNNLFGQSIYQIPADSGGGTPVNEWISFNRADWTINQTTSMFVRYIQESLVNPAGSVNNSPYNGYDTAQHAVQPRPGSLLQQGIHPDARFGHQAARIALQQCTAPGHSGRSAPLSMSTVVRP